MKKLCTLLFVMSVVLLAGCSQASTTVPPDSNTSPSSNSAASSTSNDKETKEKVSLTLFMGPAQGTWAPVAHALKQNFEKLYPELTINIQPGGGAANVEATNNGTADIGMVTSTSAYDGWAGNAPFPQKTDKIRQLGVLFPMHLYLIVPGNSDIQTLNDIKGKTVNVANRGSSTEVMNWVILGEMGITENDIKAERLGETDAFRSMQDGHIDLIMQLGATPYPPLLDIAATSNVRVLSLSEELIQKVRERNNGLVPTSLTSVQYPNIIKEDVLTLSSPVNLIVNADMDAAIVEKLVNGLHEMQGQLKENFSFVKSLDEQDIASDVGIPFHEGAERYYKSQGWLK